MLFYFYEQMSFTKIYETIIDVLYNVKNTLNKINGLNII